MTYLYVLQALEGSGRVIYMQASIYDRDPTFAEGRGFAMADPCCMNRMRASMKG